MNQVHGEAAIRQIHIEIEGIVQGVGFRPFLHRLADEHRITGWVRNTSAGLEGVLQGTARDLEAFQSKLQNDVPPMARIEAVRTSDISSGPFDRFMIRESHIRPGATLVSPDIAMCPECEAELYAPADRRYHYPFINCTNCGPRYTIIEDLPYDRARTVMNEFAMCPECASEYHDIRDRRYHAQPDCCGTCGPQVFFCQTGEDAFRQPRELPEGEDAFRQARKLLADGGVLAVKGIGGIHLACDALNPKAVKRLRERKHRPEKPLALMCRSLESARRICEITPAEEKLLTGPERPIVLLAKKAAGHSTPGNERIRQALDLLSFSPRLGVMLPYTPLHTLLLDGTSGCPDILVMTSGNISGCPVLTDNEEALSALKDVADGFLLHNRRIQNRCDDSLIMEWQGAPYFLRRSRGYAPAPVTSALCLRDADGIFAMGAEQKASFALGRGSHIFLSPYIGDLKNAETFSHYTGALGTYEKLFRLKPSLFVCDLHPDYLSTGEARQRASAKGIPLMQVQHHWAHMVSCMADNDLSGPCFGIIWDGTGLGTDGTVWGGEFLIGDAASFRRAGSIRPAALPGGDRAVYEIGRIALALVYDAFHTGSPDPGTAPGTALANVPLPEDKLRMLVKLLDHAGGTPSYAAAAPQSPSVPAASSIGRLFDGVCALITGRGEVSYDGEGAALVESLSPEETPGPDGTFYETHFYEQNDLRIFDTRPMIRGLLNDIRDGITPGATAIRFMNTLIRMAADQCLTLNPGRLPVILSGGVFQNRFLLHGLTAELERLGYMVYTHHRISTNDEGICLGQLAIACTKRRMKHVSGNANENQ